MAQQQQSDSGSLTQSLPLPRKLLLVAAMMGNEICVSFQQLYEVPLLQALGVPVAYVTLFPIGAGPVALLLLALSGYFVDKGSNPRARKAVAMLLISAVTMLGIALVIVANFIALSADSGPAGSNSTTNQSSCLDELSEAGTTLGGDNQSLVRQINESRGDGFGAIVKNCEEMNSNHSAEGEGSLPEEQAFSLSVTAALGLCGFGLMDIGYDVNQAAIRACVLASSAQNDHTVLLILSLAMAALGGCVNNLLGLVDLSHVLDVGTQDGSLAAQTTVQLMVCGLILVVTMASTVTSSLCGTSGGSGDYTPLLGDNKPAPEKVPNYGMFQTSEQTLAQTGDYTYHETSLCQEEEDKQYDRSLDPSGKFEDRRTSVLSGEDESPSGIFMSSSERYRDLFDSAIRSSPGPARVLSSESVSDAHDESICCGLSRPKVNFIVACIAAYLGTSVIFAYNLFVSDFLGKEVMGGDSTAPQGSAESEAYEEGVRLGAAGLLTFFCCYLLISCVHGKLLNVWGLKVDFSLSHALMAAAILSLTLSKQLALYYVCCVVYGIQRCALFSVPFIIANNYAQSQERSGQSVTGKAMSLLACMIPLNYCTVFLISGPLIALTQYEGASLLLSAASAGLAALLFFLLYRS